MINKEQLVLWWKIFHRKDSITEVRLLAPSKGKGKITYSGYYTNLNNVIRDVEKFDEVQGVQMYFVLNEINKACYNRPQREVMIQNANSTTSDSDIAGRRWVMIDLDPIRPADTGSTNEQLEHARIVANKVFKFLKEQGFTSMVVAKSGNGYHIDVSCMMGNTPENEKLVSRFLSALAMLFNDDDIHVDVVTKNAARICKLYGTQARKGSNTEETPWRMSEIIKQANTDKYNDIEYFRKVANIIPEESRMPSRDNNFGRNDFNVEEFLQKYGIGYTKKDSSDGTKYILDECPFDSNHKAPDAMVFQNKQGALSFFCFHNSCQQYTWKDFRMKFEPDAYDRMEYEESRFKQMRYMSKQQFNAIQQYKQTLAPIQETQEKGSIWLKMSQVRRPKFDISDYIPSGIEQIDKLIVGWKRKHVSVWSGYRACGKSSLLNMVILNAAQLGYKSALWTGELDSDEVKKWLYLQAAGRTYNRQTTVKNFYYTPGDICDKIDSWMDNYFWLFNNEYGNNFQQIEEQVRELKKNADIDQIIFDNLMTLDIDDLTGDKNDRQKNLMYKLTTLARELNIHIHIVAHPNKSGTFLRPNNISGTGHIPDLAQNVFIMHRINQDFNVNAADFLSNYQLDEILSSHCTNCIEICKCRDKGTATDNFIKLFFEIESNRLKNDIAENVQYNWIPNVEQQTIYTTEIQENSNFDIKPNESFMDISDDVFDMDSEVPF